MRADTFLFQFLSAMPATVFIADTLMDFPHKYPYKIGKEGVTYINMSRQNKEEVAKDTTRHQSQQVEYGCRRSQLAEKRIKHG